MPRPQSAVSRLTYPELGRQLQLQRFKHLLRMVGGLGDPSPMALHLAMWIDPDRRSYDSGGFLAVHDLLAIGTIARHHRLVRITQQCEVEIVLVSEFLVRLGAVRRDSEHYRAEIRDLLIEIPETAGLLGTPGRVIPGIEVKNHMLSSKVRQTDLIALRVC